MSLAILSIFGSTDLSDGGGGDSGDAAFVAAALDSVCRTTLDTTYKMYLKNAENVAAFFDGVNYSGQSEFNRSWPS